MADRSLAQREYLGTEPLGDAIAQALLDLLTHDSYLLEVDANERSIAVTVSKSPPLDGLELSRVPEWAAGRR